MQESLFRKARLLVVQSPIKKLVPYYEKLAYVSGKHSEEG